MPTTRRQSAGPSTPSATSSSLTPKPSSSRSTRRSLSHTPSQSHSTHPHGHRTADEIMLAEAEQILHPHPHAAEHEHEHAVHHRRTAAQLAADEASEMLGDENLASPALRSGRLRSETSGSGTRARRGSKGGPALIVEIPSKTSQRRTSSANGTDQEEDEGDDENDASALLDEGEVGSTAGKEVDGVVTSEQASAVEDDEEEEEQEEIEDREKGARQHQSVDLVSESSHTAGKDDVSFTSSTTVQPSSARLPLATSLHSAKPVTSAGTASEESEETSCSEDDSDSESDSSSATSESEDDDESEDEAAEDARLEKLLAAAKLSAGKASVGVFSVGEEGGMGEQDMLRLDADEEVKDTPIPQMIIPGLPPPSLRFGESAQAGPSRPIKASSRSDKGKERAVELDNREYSRPLTKREKANQPKKATPSELWSTLPSARADLLPQMKRDYQALALANSMDPKRFMKGGQKVGRVPENFAIGTVVEAPRHLQETTMTRETKYRPGQLVQDVVQDTGVGEYAKRKFGDLQWKRMENGRGKGWKKRTKW